MTGYSLSEVNQLLLYIGLLIDGYGVSMLIWTHDDPPVSGSMTHYDPPEPGCMTRCSTLLPVCDSAPVCLGRV